MKIVMKYCLLCAGLVCIVVALFFPDSGASFVAPASDKKTKTKTPDFGKHAEDATIVNDDVKKE